MSDPAAFILGWLAIGLVSIGILLWPNLRAEAMARDIPWHRNKAFRLTLAMIIAACGGGLLIASVIAAPVAHKDAIYNYLAWSGWSVILGAQAIAISALGRLSPTLCFWALWGVFVIAWRGMV